MKKSELITTAEAAVGKLSKEQREDVIHYAQEIGVLEVVRILDMMRKVGCKSYYSLLGHLIKTAYEREEDDESDQRSKV